MQNCKRQIFYLGVLVLIITFSDFVHSDYIANIELNNFWNPSFRYCSVDGACNFCHSDREHCNYWMTICFSALFSNGDRKETYCSDLQHNSTTPLALNCYNAANFVHGTKYGDWFNPQQFRIFGEYYGFQLTVSVFDFDTTDSSLWNKTVDYFVVTIKNESIINDLLSDTMYYTHDRSACGCPNQGTMLTFSYAINRLIETTTAAKSDTPTYSETFGYITSPGYPSVYPINQNCQVTIDVLPYRHVPLMFVNFDINDNSSTCDTSYVAVYNGRDTQANLTGKYCNGNKPLNDWYDSSFDAVTVLFFSGVDSGASTGFNMTWNALEDVCVHTECGFGHCVSSGDNYTCKCNVGWTGYNCLTQDFKSYNICENTGRQFINNGFLISPNYPKNYLPNDDCMIQLETRPGFAFSYKFTDFDLQPAQQGICNDHISLYNSDHNDGSDLIGSYCGIEAPVFQPNFTSGPYLTIEFKTDSFAHARGFNLTFMTIINYCQGRDCGTNYYCVNLEQDEGFTCVCKSGWTGPNCDEDIDECLQDPCMNGGTCMNKPGSFFCKCSSGYIGLYCENDNYCHAETCLHGGTCSHGPNGPVCMCTAGFKGPNCENVDCGGTFTDSTGSITSPNYPSHYPPLAKCTWYITVDASSQVFLHFNDFQLEKSTGCVSDYLEIWFASGTGKTPDKVLCVGHHIIDKVIKLV